MWELHDVWGEVEMLVLISFLHTVAFAELGFVFWIESECPTRDVMFTVFYIALGHGAW